jgi:hypothetical protein
MNYSDNSKGHSANSISTKSKFKAYVQIHTRLTYRRFLTEIVPIAVCAPDEHAEILKAKKTTCAGQYLISDQVPVHPLVPVQYRSAGWSQKRSLSEL